VGWACADRAVDGEPFCEVALTTRRHDPLAQQNHGLGRRPGQGVELACPDKGPLRQTLRRRVFETAHICAFHQ